jgi:NTE family protein
MSGGGAKGAYAAGVLKGVFENLKGDEGEYDVLSGVSVGSINALGMSMFDYGQ